MLRRLALLIVVESSTDKLVGTMRLHNPDTGRDTVVPQITLLLTLTQEPDKTYCRGQLKLLASDTVFPIQSNGRFFEALATAVERDQSAG